MQQYFDGPVVLKWDEDHFKMALVAIGINITLAVKLKFDQDPKDIVEM